MRSLIRFAFHAFYNPFAFTYDAVSAVVSRGEWRAWTRAAIPFLRGARILEIAFGTGNLHLDLCDAGYAPVGIDLSPHMLAITARKFRARKLIPRLARADVCALPFPDNYFSSLVMTFPSGFIFIPAAMQELYRVLEPEGVLVWVDAAYLEPRDVWSRLINCAFALTGTGAPLDARTAALRAAAAAGIAWTWRVETVASRASRVHVFIATKK
jgi:ubiquinone/menaquinone biosynthesis C-methylase UbiE